MKTDTSHQPPTPITPVKLGRINYLNVAPLYYGLDNGLRPAWLQLHNHPPAVLNRMLADSRLDVSPVSSMAYALNQADWLLMPGQSIACEGKVMSVLLVSRRPMGELTTGTVLLTDESASAAALVKLLLRMEDIDARFITGPVGPPERLSTQIDAALIIGDAALRYNWRGSFGYVYDLGKMWHDRTRLPFVFAVWAVRKQFAAQQPDSIRRLTSLFAQSHQQGRRHQSDLCARAAAELGLDLNRCRAYFQHLSYALTPRHLAGLTCFFQLAYVNGLCDKPVEPAFVA